MTALGILIGFAIAAVLNWIAWHVDKRLAQKRDKK